MIGGVADMVPVADEFRVIVRSALKVMNGLGRMPVGVRALLRSAGAEGPHRVEVVGFTLAPRINAAGRIGDARPALELLTTDDEAEAAELAATLEALNHDRRDLSREAIEAARSTLGADGLAAPDPERALAAEGLVAVRGEWSPGVIGLVAGRLAEEYARPALVGSVASDAADETLVRCSIRAPRGFSVASALRAIDDQLLRHGGHDGAGGCTVPLSRWASVTTVLATNFAAQRGQQEPLLSVDLEPTVGARSLASLAALADYLAPTGIGNPDPLFLFRSVALEQVRLVGDGRHARLTLNIDGSRTEAIAFGRADADGHEGGSVDLVARIVQRTYRGTAKTELHVVDLQSAEERG
jgi:single-stranded-DNA-specific exonuclease